MADGQVPAQGAEGGLVEDLGDQAHVLEDQDLGAVAHRDARGLLSAVLQRVKPEVGEFGDLFSRGPDTEDAARVLGALLTGEEIVIEESIATRHVIESRAGPPRQSNRGLRSRP
ncbi:hypothetical protein GCM10027168_14980 [Streptomyces capparidis]